MSDPQVTHDLGNGYGYWWAQDRSSIGFKCPHRKRTIPLKGEGAWTLVSEEPLTITPSINCLDCGCHAFITDGRWTGGPAPDSQEKRETHE